MPTNPDLDPTPEARIAMILWDRGYAHSRLGSMGFWNSLTEGQQGTCRRVLADIAKAAMSHGRTLEEMARDAD